MSVMVHFRSNALGNLTASDGQRQKAAEDITATLRARIEGIQRRVQAAQAAQAAQAGAAAKSAPAAKLDTAPSETGRTVQAELDRDTFLRLLVTQLQHQDPTSPMDNTEMVAQLAQFSALEQMNNLNDRFVGLQDSFEFLAGNIDQLNFISAQGLLGKYVAGVDEAGEAFEGVVDAVHLQGSIVVLTVDGNPLPMTGVLSIANEAAQPPEDAKARFLR